MSRQTWESATPVAVQLQFSCSLFNRLALDLAVARGIVNMQSIGLAAIYGAPSGDLEASKQFPKKLLNLNVFWGRVLPSLEVGTAPCKNAGIRAGDLLRSTL